MCHPARFEREQQLIVGVWGVAWRCAAKLPPQQIVQETDPNSEREKFETAPASTASLGAACHRLNWMWLQVLSICLGVCGVSGCGGLGRSTFDGYSRWGLPSSGPARLYHLTRPARRVYPKLDFEPVCDLPSPRTVRCSLFCIYPSFV